MRLITNEPLIKRNAAIAKYSMFASLGIVVGSIIVTFARPEWQVYAVYVLLVAMVSSMIGSYYTNHFVREPRADQALDGALKGFDDKYSLYHYRLPARHCLISPAGVFVIVPKFHGGLIAWDGKRWQHKKGGSLLLNFFGQEGLANPNAEAAGDANSAAQFLGKKVGGEIPPVQAIIVFYNANVTIEADNPPVPALHIKQLKEYIRKLPKGPTAIPNLKEG